MSNINRLKILPSTEYEKFYGIPKFNDEEHQFFFKLDVIEKFEHDKYASEVNRCYFTLQLGYFKAKQMFFKFDNRVANDIDFLKYDYKGVTLAQVLKVPSSTRNRQQKAILRIHGYKSFNKKHRLDLEKKAAYWVKVSVKPQFIFKELLKHLIQEKIVFPSYSTMQDLIGRAIRKERIRIESYLNNHLTNASLKQMGKILDSKETDYSLTKIKKDAKDFSHKQIKCEIEKKTKLRDIYMFSKKHLTKLKLSDESIKYYASMVEHYSIQRLAKIPKSSARLYLVCFSNYKVQKINNNLLKAFIYLVDNFVKEALEISKEDVYNFRMLTNEQLTNASEVWDLFTDEHIEDLEAFGNVRNQAFAMVSKKDFPKIKNLLLANTFDREEFTWIAIEKLAHKFKLNLRVIFRNIEFMSLVNNDIQKALRRVKKLLNSNKSLKKSKNKLLTRFVDKKSKKYISVGGKVNADRYEFYLYKALRDQLDTGEVFATESIDFRSFEDDLIPLAQFKRNKKKLLTSAGLGHFAKTASEYLDTEEQELHMKFLEVNKNFEDGTNQNLSQVTKKGEKRWKLKYTKVEKSNDQKFFSKIPQVDIYWVMRYCDKLLNFSDEFSHVRGKSSKPNMKHLFAGLIGLGVNYGLSKMSSMSGISYNDLLGVYSNYLNLENIRKVTDLINNSTAKLPTFELYGPGMGFVHSSSDGQKFETRYPTMKSRYSKKYFGLKRGVSAYSLIIHGVPANSMIIGSNEHESHFVFDIVHNNSSDIETEQHSTDSHGINKANFFLLSAFGCQFAPRLNNPNEKIGRLASFKDLRSYRHCELQPTYKLERQKIEPFWENVQRILVSLATKSTTQNVLIKKLSSHKRQNSTKEAIWELDRIHESKYILDYINDYTIPQNVQRSLNQGEQYHGLRRAVEGTNAGIGSKSDLELEIWNECSRLLTSCILYYNNHILSLVLDKLRVNNPNADTSIVKNTSPISWVHVNMNGRFDFDEESSPEIEKIIAAVLKAFT